jgi:hypothetical protein
MEDMAIGDPTSLLSPKPALWASIPGNHIARDTAARNCPLWPNPDAMQQFHFSDMLVHDYSRFAEGNVNNHLDALPLLEPARHLADGPARNMTVSWQGGFARDQAA